MIRILHYIHGLSIGGAESFIANEIWNLDCRKFHFDFVVQNSEIKNKKIEEYIQTHGAKVFVIPQFSKHLWKHSSSLVKILQEGNYDFVHVHQNALINPVPLIVPRIQKSTKFIIHSHNTSNNQGGLVGLWLHKFNKAIVMPDDIIRVACSPEAGEWMFGKSGFKIINNAVDLSAYSFSLSGRSEIRHKYSIPDNCVVLGSIGRLTTQKNHSFMFEIFRQFHLTNPDSKLLVVGDGPLWDELNLKAKAMGLEKEIIFAGSQSETQKFYSAMDCFLMPSHWEGLAFAAVEAQANGLPVVVSGNVTRDIQVSENVVFTPPRKSRESYYGNQSTVNGDAGNSLKEWCSSILKIIHTRQKKELPSFATPISGSRFDILTQIKNLEELYEKT